MRKNLVNKSKKLYSSETSKNRTFGGGGLLKKNRTFRTLFRSFSKHFPLVKQQKVLNFFARATRAGIHSYM